MADISKVIFINSFQNREETSSADSLQFASFKTATYELTDVLLGKLANPKTTSAGAGDSGEYVVLDAGGQIDASMINDADIDHGSIGGLGDDDHTIYSLADGTRNYSGKVSYASHPTFSADTEIVDKKYVDDALAALGTQAEWQDSVLDVQTDNTLDPGATPTTGDRYIIENSASLHANFGTISGVADDDIVEYNGADFVVVYSPSTGAYTSDDSASDSLLYYSGTAWVQKFYESTTASLGVQKVGVDVRADLDAAGAIGLNTNSLKVNVDDSSIEINTNAIRVKALGIKDSMIDFGTGAGQVNDADLSVVDANGYFTGTDQAAVNDELYLLAKDGENGVDYTVGTGGVSLGDLVYISGNDTCLPIPLSGAASEKQGIGLCKTTEAAAATVSVLANDEVLVGALSGATAGDVYYWDGSALTTTAPSASGSYVWKVGSAKNATDLHVQISRVKKNS